MPAFTINPDLEMIFMASDPHDRRGVEHETAFARIGLARWIDATPTERAGANHHEHGLVALARSGSNDGLPVDNAALQVR